MCYFCHVLRKNPKAPAHHGKRCLDKANYYSKMPMDRRIYENGKLINTTNLETISNLYKNSCVICLDEISNMTFIPCGHVATCEVCSSKVQDCPVCRQAIVNKQKLFFV